MTEKQKLSTSKPDLKDSMFDKVTVWRNNDGTLGVCPGPAPDLANVKTISDTQDYTRALTPCENEEVECYHMRIDNHGKCLQCLKTVHPKPSLEAAVKGLEEALIVATEMLEIARDWNAPSHYDLELPESMKHCIDEESSEPTWAAIYLVIPELKKRIKALTGKRAG